MGAGLSRVGLSLTLSFNGAGGRRGSSGAAFPVAPEEELGGGGGVPRESRVCSQGFIFLLGPLAELSI